MMKSRIVQVSIRSGVLQFWVMIGVAIVQRITDGLLIHYSSNNPTVQ